MKFSVVRRISDWTAVNFKVFLVFLVRFPGRGGVVGRYYTL